MRFFRETLTVLALLLVVALTAALAAPWFIDWTKYRADIERQLSASTGLRVTIGGHIEARVLPSPRISLGDVRVLRAEGDSPLASTKNVTLEIAPTALMRGDLRFTDILIDRPEVDLSLGEDGSFSLPMIAGVQPDHVTLENAVVTGGALRLSLPGRADAIRLDGIGLEVSALSLAGPWRGAGSVQVAGHTVAFHFNSGVAEDKRLRVKFAIDPAGDIPRMEFDGAIVAQAQREGRQVYSLEGQAKFQGEFTGYGLKAAWNVAGPLRANARGIALEPLELRMGTDERQLAATGAFGYVAGEKLAELKLETPRIDADQLTGAQGKPDGAMAALGDFVGSLVSGLRTLPPLRVSFTSPAVTIGGDTLADVAMTVAPRDERSASVTLRSGLPGRASISLEGDIEGGSAAYFRGHAKFSARDPERLSQWVKSASPLLAMQIATSPFRSVDFSGDIDISAAGFLARNADIGADRSRFRGLINFTRAIGNERARFAFDLTSPALDLDHLPDLSVMTAAATSADFSIALDARAVRLARVGQGMVDAGQIKLRAKREGANVEIEQFDIANLGGATVNARGISGAGGGRFDFKLEAERLVELAQLFQRIAPGVWSDALAQRAVSLSPSTLIFSAQTERAGDALRVTNLSFEGAARGTRVSGNLAPAGANSRELSARLSLANAQTPMLLRQLGLETVPLDRLPPSRIDIEATGAPENGFTVRARATLASVNVSYDGKVGGALPQPDADGKLQITSQDASPLLQVLALALPDATVRVPVELTANVRLRAGALNLDRLEGVALGSRVAGSLIYAGAQAQTRKLTGELRLDTLTLESLAALVLGPRPPARANTIWPDFRFAAAMAEPVPADIAISAGRVLLPNGGTGENARFRLELAPNLVGISDADIKLSNGQLRGRASIRRDGANASLAGQVLFSGPIAQGDWSGALNSDIEFAGTGPSYAAIAGGLAGKGKATVENLRIANADPSALTRVLAASEEMADVTEGRISATLARELAKSTLQLGKASFDIAIAGGIASLTQTAPAAPRVSGQFNLRTLALDVTAAFQAPKPDGWNAPAPEAAIRWSGPVNAPARSLSLASLVNGLGARAIEREAARIELLEYEARERAAFNRRIRSREFLQQRETEVALWHTEQARRAVEEQRKAEEEARRREQREQEEQRAAARRAAADAEREKREKERASRPVTTPATGAPIQLAPTPAAPGAPILRPPPVLNDPAAAGRY